MADDKATGAPAATGAPSQRDTTSSATSATSATDQTITPAAGGEDTTSPTDIKDPEKRRLSQENAETRRKLREAEKRLAEYDAERAKAEEAKLSEVERERKRASDAEAKRDQTIRAYQERLVKAEIRANASSLQFHDPDDAVRLLDWSQFEYDDEGVPTNVDKLLDALAKAKPHLVKSGGAPAPASQPTRPSGGGPTSPARSSLTPPQQPVNPRDIPSLTSKDLWKRGL